MCEPHWRNGSEKYSATLKDPQEVPLGSFSDPATYTSVLKLIPSDNWAS